MSYLFQTVISCSEPNCIRAEHLRSFEEPKLSVARKMLKGMRWSTRKEQGQLKDYCPEHTVQQRVKPAKHTVTLVENTGTEVEQPRPGDYIKYLKYKCQVCGKTKSYRYSHVVGKRYVHCDGNGLKATTTLPDLPIEAMPDDDRP